MWQRNIDKIWVGVAGGLFLPLLIFGAIYLKNYSSQPLFEFLEEAVRLKLIPSMLSLSLIVNLAVFFLLYLFKYEMAPRGVILATFVWGLVIVYFRFIA